MMSTYESKFVLEAIPQSWGACMDLLPTMVHGWETLPSMFCARVIYTASITKDTRMSISWTSMIAVMH